MRLLLSTTLLLFLSFPSLVLSKTVEFDDLMKREGLYYKKFTDVPFTGEVEGQIQGRVKDGKEEGEWVSYYDNGQLSMKETYRNGKKEGEWVEYWDCPSSGKLRQRVAVPNGESGSLGSCMVSV